LNLNKNEHFSKVSLFSPHWPEYFMKNFEKLKKKTFSTNCHVENKSKIVNHKLSLILIKRLLKNFHEIFRLCSDLPIPEYDKFCGGQFFNSHGTEGMEF
jgi:hypothetical protein